MQKICCIVIACVLFLNVSAQTDHSKIYSAHLSGKVSNADKYIDSANSIRFIVGNIMTDKQEVYIAKLKSGGTYSVDIPLTITQGIFFIFNRSAAQIIISPKTDLEINFDAANPEGSLSFGGNYAAVNRELLDYANALTKRNEQGYGIDRYQRGSLISKAQKEKTPEGYKQLVLERYHKEKAFTDQYISDHKLSTTFISWATNHLKYDCANTLMRYAWLHFGVKDIKARTFYADTSYFNFFNQFPPNVPEAMISSNFKSYLHEYSTYLKSSLGERSEFKALFSLFKSQPPFLRDLLACHEAYAWIESKNFDTFAYFKDDFLSAESNPQYRAFILSEYQKGIEFRENAKVPHDALINKVPQTEADSLFNKIMAKYPNKVVYIDFWGTWCGPCRAEMPNAVALHQKLMGKDVVFVYLGVQSDEKTWKSQIAEMNISGEHYLLKNNEYSALSAKFKISTIPRYVLVNRKGNVFDDNAKRPGDQRLKLEIDALLAEK